ncbi:MAG: substrate-binding domain-containing protein [Spirochaetales bacterium]|nr:substrate-binding domain-containing protein [Spirochaetales bacterium]
MLIDNLYSSTYQQELVAGLTTAIADLDAELYVFVGGQLGRIEGDPYAFVRTCIYDLITREKIDGVIVSTTLSSMLSNEEIVQFVSRFRGIPVVFFGAGPEQYNQVLVDNKGGMGKLVRHIIEAHHIKKIAFIRGQAGHKDFDERFTAYRTELEAAGLPFDPQLVVQGYFSFTHGRKAVISLLDERKVTFGALIASTDIMAIGAKQELERRGYKIPRDIAIVGFDDIMEASSVLPGLTTVRQPYVGIAAQALSLLVDMISGREEKRIKYVSPELVIRRSCGCLSNDKSEELLVRHEGSDRDDEFVYVEKRVAFIQRTAAVFESAQQQFVKNDLGFFLDSVYEELTRQTETSALMTLEEILIRQAGEKTGLEAWHDVLTLARRFFSPLNKNAAVTEKAEVLFHKARILVADFQNIKKNQDIVFNLKQADAISRVGEALNLGVETRELREVIYGTFPTLNLRNFLFAEFLSEGESIEQSRLIALLHDGRPQKIKEDVVYPTRNLFPDGVSGFDTQVYFVLPVTHYAHKLGYVIYEQASGLATFYSTVTRELAKNFYIIKLIRKRRAAEESLKLLAADLKYRNRELQDFAHIASHDLKEPLRKIAFFGERLKTSAAEKLNGGEKEYLARMEHAVSRMEALIEGLLAYSRVTTAQHPFTQVDIKAIIGEVIQDLEVRIAETKGRVDVGELPSLHADPLQMRQLFQNLIGNALKYHAPGTAPVVTIGSTNGPASWEISVADNGVGFDQKDGERIFGIFQRLVGKNEFEGTGVGLAICKKIVERHGGTINAYSEKGKGATFVIRLPRANASYA